MMYSELSLTEGFVASVIKYHATCLGAFCNPYYFVVSKSLKLGGICSINSVLY